MRNLGGNVADKLYRYPPSSVGQLLEEGHTPCGVSLKMMIQAGCEDDFSLSIHSLGGGSQPIRVRLGDLRIGAPLNDKER